MTTDDLKGGQQVVKLHGSPDEAGAAQHRRRGTPERWERRWCAQREHPSRDIAAGCGKESHLGRSRCQGGAGDSTGDKASVTHVSGRVLVGPAFERQPQLPAEVRKQRDTIDQHGQTKNKS